LPSSTASVNSSWVIEVDRQIWASMHFKEETRSRDTT
jgi:hypothetical protein